MAHIKWSLAIPSREKALRSLFLFRSSLIYLFMVRNDIIKVTR